VCIRTYTQKYIFSGEGVGFHNTVVAGSFVIPSCKIRRDNALKGYFYPVNPYFQREKQGYKVVSYSILHKYD
jgi:hypothetical protein